MPVRQHAPAGPADSPPSDPSGPGWGATAARRPLSASKPVAALAGGIYLAATLLAAIVAPPGAALLFFVVAIAPIVILCQWDAVSVLTLAIVSLFGLSARYSLGAGSPVALIGLLCFVLWALAMLLGRGRVRERSPVRVATLVLIWFLLIGYGIAFTRVLSVAETSNGQRQFLTLVGAAGLTLLAADQIGDRQRLDVLLRRVVAMVSFMSVIAIVQYVSGQDLSEYLVPPGFSQLSVTDAAIAERSDLRRVAGTAGHPIEFGVVLAMVLPLALHYALTAAPGRPRQWAWVQVMIIGMGLPLSISRSAVLSLIVALITLAVVWDGRRQLNFLGAVLVFGAFFNVAVPGVLGTLRALFLWAGEDPSVSGRTDDYAQVWAMVAERPFFGRGLGTFIPSEYFFLDNQLLGSLLEVGYVGLGALLVWIVVGLSCARGVRRRASAPADRQLGQALVAGILAVLTSFATFDTLSFKQATFTLFLLVGCAGALWRLTAADRGAHRSDHADETGVTGATMAAGAVRPTPEPGVRA